MEYDEEKVTRLMSEARTALEALYELSELPKEEFLQNRHYVSSAKYNLLVAIEACIDIAYHLISRNKMRLPKDYADSFRVLNEREIINDDLTKRLVLMTRFRNRLVHIYWEVDDEFIYEILQDNLSDIEEFMDSISKALRREKP
ncbi:DUF86 domain-containing protein [Thermococcus sp. 9N3]|uniref:type VII toxin-antitoxin system HepT family RNase toxin n=2 Tax=unclassified Thermococcus TaxID=2627626 RepID=UPI001431CA17|nr:DUF86 domain-containing protein [Thermococcus sp. 9N3]NJE49404.1 DUF86 domain-containing protein [Thermococcus sp. 9N3]